VSTDVRPRLGAALAATLLSATALAGCAVPDSGPGRPTTSRPEAVVPPAPEEPSVAPTTPTSWGPTVGEVAEAAALVDRMTVEQLVSTVLMPGFWGYDAQLPSDAEALANQGMHGVDSAAEAVREHGFGAVFLRPEVVSDAAQVAALTQQLHQVGDEPRGWPMLVSIDQEGGGVQRLALGVDLVPSAATVGATGDLEYAGQVARDNGRSLREVGVTMVMAPVADVDPDYTSTLGSRTYSTDHRTAAAMVTATMRGYLEAGVIPTVKHFPGLGSVTGDSHATLPVQPKSVPELRATDLVPFAAAIESGAPVVMTGHVAVEAIDPGVPASLSSGVVDGVLRGTLDFEGVVVTDSQGMAPIHAAYGPGEGAVRSLVAGNDLVLNSPAPARARRAVLDAVETGRLTEERLAESAVRVLALRAYQQRLAEDAVRSGR
jgi:beta-N-acetylhexosaminidase